MRVKVYTAVVKLVITNLKLEFVGHQINRTSSSVTSFCSKTHSATRLVALSSVDIGIDMQNSKKLNFQRQLKNERLFLIIVFKTGA